MRFTLHRVVLTDGSSNLKLQVRLWPTVKIELHILRWGLWTENN